MANSLDVKSFNGYYEASGIDVTEHVDSDWYVFMPRIVSDDREMYERHLRDAFGFTAHLYQPAIPTTPNVGGVRKIKLREDHDE